MITEAMCEYRGLIADSLLLEKHQLWDTSTEHLWL